MPFLTSLDSRAAVKSSRDPLGYEPLWSFLGRRVVGNLTSVTSSLRGFTTLLLGLYFADLVVKQLSGRSAGADDEAKIERARLQAFLRFEQMAGYVRMLPDREQPIDQPRGVNRILSRLADGRHVTISEEPRHQILSDQKTYGLWGLYTVAARRSGLLEEDGYRLTEVASQFVEHHYLDRLRGGGRSEVLKAVMPGKPWSLDTTTPLAQSLADILHPEILASEVEFYASSLGSCQKHDATDGCQPELWSLLCTRAERGEEEFDRSTLSRLQAEGASDRLRNALDDILDAEPVFATTSRLFSFTLRHRGVKLDEVMEKVRGAWGSSVPTVNPAKFQELQTTLAATGINDDSYGFIVEAADHVSAGRYEMALKALIRQNDAVMRRRGGAAWLEVEASGALIVRQAEETATLPKGEDLPNLLQNSYFLNSLDSLARTIVRRGKTT